MNCPKCDVLVGDSVEQCPHCDIFFSKWRDREAKVESGGYAAIANATSSEFNWAILGVIFCACVTALYYMYHLTHIE